MPANLVLREFTLHNVTWPWLLCVNSHQCVIVQIQSFSRAVHYKHEYVRVRIVCGSLPDLNCLTILSKRNQHSNVSPNRGSKEGFKTQCCMTCIINEYLALALHIGVLLFVCFYGSLQLKASNYPLICNKLTTLDSYMAVLP